MVNAHSEQYNGKIAWKTLEGGDYPTQVMFEQSIFGRAGASNENGIKQRLYPSIVKRRN